MLYTGVYDRKMKKKMRYRSRSEIVSAILEAANGGTTKTKIMYKAFLSYAQLKEYLAILIENDLLEIVEEGTFRTTQKGMQFLKITDTLQGMMEIPDSQKRR